MFPLGTCARASTCIVCLDQCSTLAYTLQAIVYGTELNVRVHTGAIVSKGDSEIDTCVRMYHTCSRSLPKIVTQHYLITLPWQP